ncbi:50S ribosomal protein L29 [Anaplasma bovis]|uniref:50S ribosomal protein L29 n=1 Tax=Anaplasma bovis TaxID=186733 RepID=UPI002FF1E28A
MGSIADITEKSSEELKEMLLSLRMDLVRCVFEDKSTGRLNPSYRKMIKKKIARILTVLSLRKIRGGDV